MSLRHALLGLTANRELSGYDIKRIFDRTIHVVWNASDSQVYRELRSLEEDGLLSCRVIHQEHKPDRRVYRATVEGKEALQDWLESPARQSWVKDEFRLRLFFIGSAGEDVQRSNLESRKELLEDQMSLWESRRDEYANLGQSQHPELLWWQVRLLEHTLDLIRVEHRWIEQLLQTLSEESRNA